MSLNKAVFLDRDGTINKEKNYLYKIEDFEFIPGVLNGLKMLQNAGFILVIITNQSGIARGFYTEHDYFKLMNYMLGELKKNGINIAKCYYCPHLKNASVEKYRIDCECRKPKTGLFMQAIHELDIDIDKSFAIGDKISDLEMCFNTNCMGFLVGNTEGPNKIFNLSPDKRRRIEYKASLREAAEKICSII